MDVKRVRTFWRNVERFAPGTSVCGGTDSRTRRIIVVSGWIAETRILPDGRRQIFSFLLPGDVIAVGRSLSQGERGLLALSNVEIADAAVLTTGEQADPAAAAIAEAMRQREERLYDHMVRIGRLTAKERILNLLLELYDRLDAIGLVKESTFRLPLTQEAFADALGLSVVHINRTLQQLRREGMVTIRRGSVTLHQRHKLATLAYYQANGQPSRATGAGLLA
jgi:CRP-like cAMP-binding protein